MIDVIMLTVFTMATLIMIGLSFTAKNTQEKIFFSVVIWGLIILTNIMVLNIKLNKIEEFIKEGVTKESIEMVIDVLKDNPELKERLLNDNN